MAPAPEISLDDRYRRTDGRVVLSGIQALVRSTLDQRRLDNRAGRRTAVYVSGYQGSPLGGVDREFARASQHLSPEGIVFDQGLNEELGATSVGGTQLLHQLADRTYDGVTGIWFGKNPGLDRAADAIRHSNLRGTSARGGAVAWIGDDPNSKSSTVPSTCEPMCRSLLMPLLAPGSVAELLEFGLHAVAMSRHSGLWTGLKIVADVADSTATVDLDGLLDVVPALPERSDVTPPVMLPPTNLDTELDAMTRRLGRAMEYAAAAGLNRITVDPEHAEIAIVAAGMAYQAVVRALQDLSVTTADLERHGVRLVQIGMPWPLDAEEVVRLTRGVDRVLVVEDKLAFLESLFKEALYGRPDAPQILGKYDANGAPLFTPRSTIDADEVRTVLRRKLPGLGQHPVLSAVPTRLPLLASRTPAFCSGCPHSVSTRSAPDQLVGAGIGCHIMVALEDSDKRGELVGMPQMGGEGAQWLGLHRFTEARHFIQNLGDGTFYHSGSLALRAAVAANAHMTYRLLFNDAVAMTGGQSPSGQMDVPTLTRWLAAEGVAKVIVTTANPQAWRRVRLHRIARVVHRDQLETAQRELADTPGVTVLLHIDRCATEERRLRKRGKVPAPAERIWINERVCEGCGDCGEKSTCLSVLPVETEYGRKTQIHQSSCNQDTTCTKGDCPSFVTVVPTRPRVLPAVPAADLPAPVRRVSGDVLVRMPGIGGTGVVTISQVLQMAAFASGRHAASLEQIGLAQKGGPVISDLRISTGPISGQVKASKGSVDVMLAFDALGATTDTNLRSLRPGALAVVNTRQVPTARMVQDIHASLPAWNELEEQLSRVTNPEANLYLDAQGLAERFFGDHLPTNMVLVGAAFQHGALPLEAAAIERAIRLNGAAVATNLDAFHLGRLAVARPEALEEPRTAEPQPSERALALVAAHDLEAGLHRTVVRLTDELIGYQDEAYAALFLDRIARARSLRPDAPRELLESYARGLFKLMAYKDEYEVARLHLDATEKSRLEAEFGPGARVRLLLHPPVLRALGVDRKISAGRWIVPLLVLLRAARRLRGTRLDPFGYAAVRRIERSLPREYVALVESLLADATRSAAELAEAVDLPDGVRGYEEVKLSNVQAFRDRAAALRASDLPAEAFRERAAV